MLQHNLPIATQRSPHPITVPQQRFALRAFLTAAPIFVSVGLLLLTVLISAIRARLQTGSGTNPLLILALGVLLAHGSLVGIWWARSTLPSHLKTLLTALAMAGLWVLIIFLLDTAQFRSAPGAGWAACLATQVLSMMLLTMLVEVLANPSVLERRHRFSIFFLLIWTTVIAVLLGVGRRIAEWLGWSPAMLVGWEYFLQVQTMAAINVVLAISLLASLQLTSNWPLRLIAVATLAPTIALLAPLLMQWMFKSVGADYFEIVGLLLVESLVLLFVIAPLEVLRKVEP